ncbi:acetylornithine deacetylase/succinyl-diaminopimelate desuccinylase-like protein [Thermocatellispora tengchongensis]|uniref:Acetylornithine deacetylase/succinyl-diaminopimelate desuccinylase-like protein n=1 Tax=Thermocatellispora tengchongensis TaxID=1073253 RepID=A0A840PGP2_9ACTN|nr:M20/M25/M40 family metallo-hydrolase [Thermocatellispora tengchongensis]MBB5140584.1 acetylornithine deacetylase/succinyl-diaminopimelate desuccinylase-like protein [Thermocatellispora tengchongensis]
MTRLKGEDEVVELCRDLIRIDSTNAGDNAGPGERAAAEYVAEKLAEVGLEPRILESDTRRANVVARIEGEDPGREALLLHGHLDVVPFNAGDWTRHPLSGEVADGCVWGRGAVDMKDMDAMILAVVRQRLSEGRRPPRDVVLAFTADEEAGGKYGAQWLVERHPGLFEGCTEAIGEVGGFSVSIGEQKRLYLIEAAEKGIAWMRLTARGRAGHGSMLNADNAVTELAEAVARIGRYEWPVRLTPTVRAFLEETSAALNLEFDPDNAEATVAKLGPLARMIGAVLRNTTNPTMLDAGYKANVIPQEATAHVDGRFLPGYEDEFFQTLDELLGPNVTREFVYHDIAVETGFEGPLVRAMADALVAEDPGAHAVPYTLSGGTDLKAFSRLGIRGFGFAPLKLPADLDFSGMFHGVDERVPVDSLQFGVRVLDRFLDQS